MKHLYRLLTLYFLLLFANTAKSQEFIPGNNWVQMDRIAGSAGLYQKDSAGVKYYLQVIDLRNMVVDQVTTGVQEMNNAGIGKYTFGAPSFSPSYRTELHTNFYSSYAALWGSKLFTVMNGQFLEDPDLNYATQVSFPVKISDVLLTGGSSSLGPGTGNTCNPSNVYCNPLKVLNIFQNSGYAEILDYNSSADAKFDAIVAYKYTNHPANNGTPQSTRFHVVGLKDVDNNGLNETMLIVTADQTTIGNTGKQLVDLGLSSNDLLSLDGGGSTYLSGRNNPNLEEPRSILGPIGRRQLSHYLGFRTKGSSPQAERITVTGPNGGLPLLGLNTEMLEIDTSYIITWRDNLVGSSNGKIPVKISLYYDGKFLKDIVASTFNLGAYEWTPREEDLKCVPNPFDKFKIRITSTTNASVFDESDANFTIVASGFNELVKNGNFECDLAAYNYFQTEYSSSTDLQSQGEGKYTVTANSAIHNTEFSSCGDHTVYGDKMLLANGATTSKVVWQQSIGLGFSLTNRQYVFRAWVSKVSKRNAANLQFLVNDAVIGRLDLPCNSDCQFVEFVGNWTSPGSIFPQTATLKIKNLNTDTSGVDFAIDDISFKLGSPATGTYGNDPCLQVLVPNTNVNFKVDTTYQIQWVDNLLGNVKIELLKNDLPFRVLAASTPSDGLFGWTPGSDLDTCGKVYSIKISSVDNDLSDVSDVKFSIGAGSSGLSFTNPSFEGPVGISIAPTGWDLRENSPDVQPFLFTDFPAYDGNTYLGMVANDSYHESIGQSKILQQGTNYSISLRLASVNYYSADYFGFPGRLSVWIGTSSSPFGQLVWTSPAVTPLQQWKPFSFSFTPLQNTSYIMLRAEYGGTGQYGNILVDDIRTCGSGETQARMMLQEPTHSDAGNRSLYREASPNPFHDEVVIPFTSTESTLKSTRIIITDVAGRIVSILPGSAATLSGGSVTGSTLNRFDASGKPILNPGGLLAEKQYLIRWDASSGSGNKVLPGIYFYKVTGGNKNQSGKLLRQ